MSKETMERFLEKSAAIPELAEKLKTLKQSYLKQIIELANEQGILLTEEDFCLLTDHEATEATGGIRPLYQPLIREDRFIFNQIFL